MNKLKVLLFFHIKFVLPATLFTLLIGVYSWAVNGVFSIQSFGFGYLISTPAFQYLLFELRRNGEYYFYFNLGLSRRLLWISNFCLGLLGAVIISLLAWGILSLTVS